MKLHRLLPFLAAAALCLSLDCHAKGLNYEVINIPAQYSHNITKVFVVPGSFIWGGTDNGLIRMGHYEFTHFSADGNPGSIPGNYIRNIGTDAKNNFWITTDNGLALYNIESDNFTTMQIEENGEMHNVITFSGYLVDDNLLIGGVNRLYVYNYDQKKIELRKEINAVPPFNVDEIYPITEKKLLLFDHTQGFLEYDFTENTISPHETALEVRDSYCYFVDSQKRFWRSLYNKGIECFDMDGNLLASYTVENSNLSNNLVTCFIERQGKIWAGTLTGGINIIDPLTGKIEYIKKVVGNANDFPANSITSLFCDHNDNVWAVRENGGMVVIRESYCKSFYISPTADYSGPISLDVSDFSTYGPNDNLWIGTRSEGIFYINRTGPNSFGRVFRVEESSNFGILAMTTLTKDKILVACLAKGLYVLDKKDQSFRPANLPDKSIDYYLRSGNKPISMCHDDADNIIIVTDNFYKYNPRTNELSLIKYGLVSDTEHYFSTNGNSGNFFHGRRIVYKWFPKTNTLSVAFDMGRNVINSAASDRDGNIWLACDDGLYKLESDFSSIKKIDNDLINSIQTINCDRQGRIWMGTPEHVFVYLPATDAFIMLDISDGLRPNNFTSAASLITVDGTLVFGGTEGVSLIDLSIPFDEEEKNPQIKLMSLYLNDTPIPQRSHIKFKPTFNKIVVRIFVSEDDILKAKNHRFRIVSNNGYDVTITNEESYTNIRERAPGKYTVYAACTLRNGDWCDWQEVIHYRIIPAWYQNPFILAAIFAILIVAVIWVLRLRMRSREDDTRIKFLLNVSHELKTPLTLIIGPLSRVLKETPKDDKHYQTLANASRQAQRMRSLILTVLDANKIEEGSAVLHAENINYNTWVSDIAEDFREELQSKNISLNILLDESVTEAEIDPQKLENVLTNILINAVKHTPDGGSITVGTILQPDGTVRTYVDDTGEGLGDVDTEKIFSRFYQGVTEKTGSGMGLAYANSIVKIHNGKMGADNNPKGGARFFYDIPKHIAGAILALLMLTGAAFNASAQNSILSLHPSNGYPSKISSIHVDDFGFAFLGSNSGVCCVSGDNMDYFSLTGGYSLNLPSDNVRKVLRDRAGNVWVLTDRGITGIIPPSSSHARKVIDGIDPDAVAFSAIAMEDAIYFGGTNTIWQYAYSTGTFSKFATFETATPFDITDIVSFKGSIILASSGKEKPVFFYPLTGDISETSFTDEGGINAIITDSRGWLWYAKTGQGITCLDENFNVKATYTTKNSGLTSDLATCLTEIEGLIWAGTYGGGINVINPLTGDIEVHRQNARGEKYIPNDFINTITSDRRGNIWVGSTHNGTFIILNHGVSFYEFDEMMPGISSGGINAILTDKQTSLWLGFSGAGIARINSEGEVTHYPSTNGMNVYDISNGDGELLFSCIPGGMYSFNKTTGAYKALFPDKVQTDFHKYQGSGPTICSSSEGRKIIIADSVYVWHYSTTKALESYPLPKEAKDCRIHVVDGSSIYFKGGNTLFKWDDESPEKLIPVLSIKEIGNITDASLGKNGDIWMVSGKGLSKYNTESDSLTYFDLDFDSTPQCLMVQGSSGGMVWIGTRKSLYLYRCESGQLIHIDKSIGAMNNKYEAATGTLDEDDNFYMGGRDGVVRVSTSAALNSIKAPAFLIDAIYVDDVFQENISNLTIKPSYESINLRFVVMDVDVLRPKKCRFIIDGPDSDIIETYTPVLTFNNHLAPGRYSIKGQISTLDGSWTDVQDITSFKVRQHPLLRWWAILIYVAILCCLTAFIVQHYLARKNMKKDAEGNKERYNFLIDISHELRTPLTLILGPLGRVLRNKNLPQEEIPRLENIKRQAERMNDLLATILTTDKIERGAAEIHKAPVDLNEWIADQAAVYKDEASARNMDIVMELDNTVGKIEMDCDLCRIVFFNIMTNAIKHNQPGSPITVRTKNFPAFSKVRINIADNGCGLENVDVTKLFTEFYKGTEDKSGFGIGLYYSKAIVDAHNGHIGAFNNTGDRGATFWFELPYGNTAAPAPQPAKPAEASKQETDVLKEMIALCVDDDKDLRLYIKDELSEYFKAVLTAADGKEALKILSTEKVDLVISDVMMPEMDGMELCRTIKSNPALQTIPVCLLTAKVDSDSRKEGLESGADAYLPKPFDTDEIAEAVRKIMFGK